MKSLLYIFPVLLFTLGGLRSQDVIFKLELSNDTILLGNVIELKYSIENTQGAFKAPDFNDLTIVSGPNVSSQFSMINGRVTQSSSYTYFLRPETVGTFNISAAQLENGENVWHTLPVTITVLSNPDGIIQNYKGFGFKQQIVMKDTILSPQDSILLKLKKVKTYKI
jgi:hypothetical protein